MEDAWELYAVSNQSTVGRSSCKILNLERTGMKRAVVTFKGAREKGAMTSVGCLGAS